MPSTLFAELVGRLLDGMGQSMASTRSVPEGILVTTTDKFLFAFLEDPAVVSLGAVQRLVKEAPESPARLVVLTPGRLPLALNAELLRSNSTVVDGARFGELVKGLGLESYLGQEPRPVKEAKEVRLLPSAQQLDDVMSRANTWSNWGVPALALRFYRQAGERKPEFLPARNGLARALLGLGLVTEAEREIDRILELHPDDLEARLGKAAVQGARGQVDTELATYRGLLAEDANRVEVRAHLVAALVEAHRWPDASKELQTMLDSTPDDARLRYLYSVALRETGSSGSADRELSAARQLGLPRETERTLASHLGLPEPSFPKEPVPIVNRPAKPPTVRRGSRSRVRSPPKRKSSLSGGRHRREAPRRRVRLKDK